MPTGTTPNSEKYTTTSIRIESGVLEEFKQLVHEDERTVSSEIRRWIKQRVAERRATT